MQAIFETLFDVVYLTTVITLGILMIRNGKKETQFLFIRNYGCCSGSRGFLSSCATSNRTLYNWIRTIQLRLE